MPMLGTICLCFYNVKCDTLYLNINDKIDNMPLVTE